MSRFPDVSATVEQKIDELIEQEGPRGFPAQLEEAWETLPEPRLEWNYYPQLLAQSGCKAGVKRSDWDLTEKWLQRGRAAYAAVGDTDATAEAPMDHWEARLKVARGDADARDFCNALLEKHGPRFFTGKDDAAVRDFLAAVR